MPGMILITLLTKYKLIIRIKNLYLGEGSFNFFNCPSYMSIKMNDSKEIEAQSICQTTEKPKKRKKTLSQGTKSGLKNQKV